MKLNELKQKVVVITNAWGALNYFNIIDSLTDDAVVILATTHHQVRPDLMARWRDQGATVTYIPTDVSSEHQVRSLAKAVLANYGRIDVWI